MLALAIALLLPAQTPQVQEPAPLITDRPGNGNAASVVPPLTLQVETSAGYALDVAADNAHAFALPTWLRFGVLSWLELRLANGLIGIDSVAGQTEVRGTDLVGGVKLGFLSNDGARPDLAMSIDVAFPTGSGAFTLDAVVPEARLLAAWALPAGFGLLVNFGADLPESGSDRILRLLYVVNSTYVLPAFEDRWSVFAELFGRADFSAGATQVLQIDVGTAFLLSPLVQLDLFTQHALTGASPDFQLSLGLSFRFPR